MPWPIVPAPSTPTHRIGRAEALLFFSSESLLNVLSQKRGRTARWIRILGHGIGWGLPGSTNSYANSYTIRATENANRFLAIQYAAASEQGEMGAQASRLLMWLVARGVLIMLDACVHYYPIAFAR